MFPGTHRAIMALALAATPILAGCTSAGCAGSQGIGGQEGVCNETDHFAYGGQVSGRSDSDTFTWHNTKSAASVEWGGQGAGSVTVTIQDAAGKQVFSKSFTGAGQAGASTKTSAGTAGDWTIKVSFKAFSGQMGLVVDAS